MSTQGIFSLPEARPVALEWRADETAVVDLWQACGLTRPWNDPHKDIARKLHDKDIEHRKYNRECLIVLGLPGAGKTTAIKKIFEADGSTNPEDTMKDYLETEGDNAKELIPEFNNGDGAGASHEESSFINKLLLRTAVKHGENIIWPRIDGVKKIERDLKMLKKAGYHTRVVLVDVSQQTAELAALKRYLTVERYVSTNSIHAYGDDPRKTYMLAHATGLVDPKEERWTRGGPEEPLRRVS
jgi:adenylate kinase family enzyme